MIPKNVLLGFMVSYPSVQISPQFRPACPRSGLAALVLAGLDNIHIYIHTLVIAIYSNIMAILRGILCILYLYNKFPLSRVVNSYLITLCFTFWNKYIIVFYIISRIMHACHAGVNN